MTDRPTAHRISGRGQSPLVVHQLLHGYDNGHHLLAASAPIAPELLRVIDRLSDATGTTPHPDESGYLSGYPLPDGSYALARTWPAKELPRPNCVWTHTLLLRAEHLVDMRGVLDLLHHFRRPLPSGTKLAWYEQSIGPISDSEAPLQEPSADLPPVTLEVSRLIDLCAALYSSDTDLAWLEVGDPGAREHIALNVWAQQWPTLRRRFAFCTGALEPRLIGDRQFDLCLVPKGATPPFLVWSGSPHHRESSEVEWLALDLAQPHGDFRRFVGFGAAGSTKRTTMLNLTRLWRALHELADGAERLGVIEHELRLLGPRPEDARRVKRAMFRLPGAAVLGVCSPNDVVRALIQTRLASMLRPDDASADTWMELAWQDDVRGVLEVLVAGASASKRDAARRTMLDHLNKAIVKVASPSEFGAIATATPELAAMLLLHHNDPSWWATWAQLPREELMATTRALKLARPRQVDWESVTTALVGVQTDAAQQSWIELAAEEPNALSAALVRALAGRRSAAPNAWKMLLAPYSLALIDRLPSIDSAEARVLADIVPPDQVAIDAGLGPWRALENRRELEALGPGLGLLFLAGWADGDPAHLPFLGSVYAVLYERLADTAAAEEWNLVKAFLAGDKDHWDRCQRLAKTLAKKAETLDSGGMAKLLSRLRARDARARAHLRAEMPQRSSPNKKKKRILGVDVPQWW